MGEKKGVNKMKVQNITDIDKFFKVVDVYKRQVQGTSITGSPARISSLEAFGFPG